MDAKDKDFFKKLTATFKLEAEEHIKNISMGLIEMEESSSPEKQAELIETVFRESHSLKGAARSVNITEIEVLCQSMESVFAALKRHELSLSVEMMDILHLAVNNLQKLLLAVDRERNSQEKAEVATTIKFLEDILKGVPTNLKKAELPKVENKETSVNVATEKDEVVRITTSKLESILMEAEELVSAKLAADHLVSEIQNLSNHLAEWDSQWTRISPNVRSFRKSQETGDKLIKGKKISTELRLLEFIDWNYGSIKSMEDDLVKLARIAKRDMHNLSNMTDNLLEETKRVLMFPFSSLVEVLPKLVRDLSREQGKDIKLVISGERIEIDRRILDEMKDPLIHLMRNCIDHGIEKPEERRRKGKSPQGTITIAISQKTNSSVEILVSDDGAGINTAAIRASAVKRGIMTSDEADKLGEQETLSLLGRSGISTSPIITDISGRGLGMAIVIEKVEKVHGTISIETHPDRGTTFRITLPVTVAVFRGVIARLDERFFAIPTNNVERAVRIRKDIIKTIEDKETIQIDGHILSLVRLKDILELPYEESEKTSPDYVPVLILTYAEKELALLVDEVVNEQEILVKSLGPQLPRVRNILGVSIMATGKMVPVLNIADLMKSAIKVSPGRTVTVKTEAKKQSVMVVEDSITSRMLLKNILEAAGYYVRTAVDGVDAFNALKTNSFDLVVSDVDMPRMNGFDLTAKIRADKKLSELPLILVTALESREHRERGVEVGANAYIVKSSFDQSNLLETIRRLI
jgi:two-component system chemotaxis sensor kinase CheA